MANEEITEKFMQELRECGAAYAKAKTERSMLEHYRPVCKARIMAENSICTKTGKDLPISKQERIALTHPDYLQCITELSEKIGIEAKTKWDLKLCEIRHDRWKTKMYQLNAEKKGYQ